MTTKRAVTLRLPNEDFQRLEHEAERAGVRPGTFARMVLHGYLQERAPDPRPALKRLRKVRQQIRGDEPMDAVAIVREGRDELEGRHD